jgi:serine protease Do
MNLHSFFRHPLVAAALGAAVVGAPLALRATAQSAAPAAAPASRAVPLPDYASQLPGFSALVERYGPAVVNISVKATVKESGIPDFGFGPDDPFFRFFQGIPMPRGRERDVPVRGEGSGFIVRANGIVLTNAHVVDGAREVTVKLTDKREFTARVLGADDKSDVAVLKINARDLPTVQVGDAAQVKVGDWVVAIGAPFGFENSVTQGIVSAKGRTLPDGSYVPFIQTDVAINPGNSGGPLFNLKGEVVGINSQIYSRSGGYQGVSFAIPVDVAMSVAGQLEKTGHVTRGRIGVGIQPVNQALAESFGLKQAQGALVSSVEKNSPAERAGIEAGDVILSLDGRAVTDASELPVAVASLAPGTKVTLGVWRKGRLQDVKVTLGEMAPTETASADEPDAPGRLGLAVRPLSPSERREAGTDGGLRVEDASGPAAEAGIQAGDIVLSANGQPVRTVEQLRQIVANTRSHVALLVQRGETRIFVPVQIG